MDRNGSCSNCNVKIAHWTQKTHFHPQYQLKQTLERIKKCRQRWRRTSRQGRSVLSVSWYSFYSQVLTKQPPPKCHDTCESRKQRDHFCNALFISTYVNNFYGCPRPWKYFNTKIITPKFPNTKISQITVCLLYSIVLYRHIQRVTTYIGLVETSIPLPLLFIFTYRRGSRPSWKQLTKVISLFYRH